MESKTKIPFSSKIFYLHILFFVRSCKKKLVSQLDCSKDKHIIRIIYTSSRRRINFVVFLICSFCVVVVVVVGILMFPLINLINKEWICNFFSSCNGLKFCENEVFFGWLLELYETDVPLCYCWLLEMHEKRNVEVLTCTSFLPFPACPLYLVVRDRV